MNLENINADAVNAEVNIDALSKQFNTNVVTSFKFSPEKEEEMATLAGIATDSPEELTAMNNIAKGLGTTVPQLGETWKKYTARYNMTEDKAFQLLTASIQLGGKVPAIYTFDPDDKYRTYTDKEKVSAYKTILDMSPDSAFNSIIYMLAPYMKYNKESGMTIPGYTTLGSPKQKQDYVVKKLGGQFKNFGELDKAVTANETAVYQLEEYVATLDMTNAPIAYQKTKLFLNSIFGFTDDRSFFGALTRDLFTGNQDENRQLRGGEYYLDENNAYQSFRDEKIRAAEDMGLSAELEAFRVGLAFQMARAADPSGRLSNQDIELQMVRLGAEFRTVGDAVRATGVVLDQFKDELQKYKVFRDFGNGTGDMKDAEVGVIDAAIVISDMERVAKRMNVVTERATAAAITNYENKSEMPSNTYTTKDGEAVFMALTPDGRAVTGPDGNRIYTDGDGNVRTELVPKNQPIIPEPKGGDAPKPKIKEEEDPKPDDSGMPIGAIEAGEFMGENPRYTAVKSGDNYTIVDKSTGKELPGTYKYESVGGKVYFTPVTEGT
jgi:hypothetical protein